MATPPQLFADVTQKICDNGLGTGNKRQLAAVYLRKTLRARFRIG
jgi:hypothetical protein